MRNLVLFFLVLMSSCVTGQSYIKKIYKKSGAERLTIENHKMFFEQTSYDLNKNYLIFHNYDMSGREIVINDIDTLKFKVINKIKYRPGIKLYEVKSNKGIFSITYLKKKYIIEVNDKYKYMTPVFGAKNIKAISYYEYVLLPEIE